MVHYPKEHYHANHDSYDVISHNTRSKRRAIENATPSSSNQNSTLGIAPSTLVTSIQQNVAPQHNQDMINKKPTKSQTAQCQS